MKATPQHSYQILTKRPKQMYEVVSTIYRLEALGAAKGFWSHVWLGISAEDQPTFEERVRYLIQTPAAVRFVSLEPLLGSVDARRVRIASPKRPEGSIRPIADWVECDPLGRTAIDELGVQYSIKQGLDWVIVGGESGPGARPLNHRWVRDIRDQCQVAGVPFWFKQWGEWAPDDRVLDIVRRDRTTAATTMDAIVGHVPGMRRVGKKRAGNELDGRVWEEMP
jgi:protein gp37